MGEFFSWLHSLGEKVFNEAGILAFILFWSCIYLGWDNRCLRKDYKELSEKSSDRLFQMGTDQVKTSMESNHILDKMSDTIASLTALLERKGILRKKESHND